MSNVAKDVSEKTFQENLTQELQKYRWKAPDELNGNLHKVTVDDLVQNWRGELNRLNADMLEGVPLTDDEFSQVMARVRDINNSYEVAKLLAMENGKGKIDGIWRDKNPKLSRRQVTLTIFCKAQVSGGSSSYQIAREVQSDNNNRFDMILLICGLPLINIELKRTDHTLEEAYQQFKRYYSCGEYTHGFLAFSQMMVICSEIDMRYFATPKSLEDFNEAFAFHWSDKKNHIVSDWRHVASDFLMVPMAHQMVGDYLVIDEAENDEDKKHMLMRPYQVYALQAVELAAFGRDGKADDFAHGGYVWHTTGSGKTITSFKTALFLSTRAGFDKVVFLVDRRELDKNSRERFKAYSAYEAVDVDDTKYTYILRRRLSTPKSGIIVTTTFKLHNLVKELNETGDTSLAEKKIVFIIDEAHRTTMDAMMGDIKAYFRKSGLFFGFTGTPLFDENKARGMVNEQAERINTTEKLFGPLLHAYTIDEAIRDRNVLAFHVDYINTGEFKSYESLREDLAAIYKQKHPNKSEREIERSICELEDFDVELEAQSAGLIRYTDETHIPQVVSEILKGWEAQSRSRKFNAILTAARIERAIAYYNEFKRQLACVQTPIHIATTFSFGTQNAIDTPAKSFEETMFSDYETFSGIKFLPGDKKSEEAYFADLVERTKRGGSGRNPKNIDLVIVADQLLTGYDSKFLNTLYVDRELELQSLVQAYSRTNRIYGADKEFGTIVNYRYPAITRLAVDEALKLYGSGGTSSLAIVDTYEVAVQKLRCAFEKMTEALPVPSKWSDLETDDEAKKAFMEAFKDSAQQYNKVSQYYEFSWDEDAFGMDEHQWKHYIGAYKNLKALSSFAFDSQSDPAAILGASTLVASDYITAEYILKLIGDKSTEDSGKRSIDGESLLLILEKIQEFSDLGEDRAAQRLRAFVQDIQEGKIAPAMTVGEAYAAWTAQKVAAEVEAFAARWGANEELLKSSLDSYDLADPDYIPMRDELGRTLDFDAALHKEGDALDQNIAFKKELAVWMPEIKRIGG